MTNQDFCLWATWGLGSTLSKSKVKTKSEFSTFLTNIGITASSAWIDSTSEVTDNPNHDGRFELKLTLVDTLLFQLYDNGQLFIGGEINFGSKIFVSPNTADTFISAIILDDGSLQVRVISGSFLGSFFSFLLSNPTNPQTIRAASLKIMPQTAIADDNIVTMVNSKKKLSKILVRTTDLQVQLFAQTDNFGLNLGEMAGIVNATKSYPNAYPKELIGVCKDVPLPELTNFGLIQTCYSFKPKLSKVLKGKGDTLLAQTNDINAMYNSGLLDCDFYLNIVAYCTYRYMLAGLSNGSNFSRKWLYANHYEEFLINLENSEFSAAVEIFTKPQPDFNFTNFNRYFVDCVKK